MTGTRIRWIAGTAVAVAAVIVLAMVALNRGDQVSPTGAPAPLSQADGGQGGQSEQVAAGASVGEKPPVLTAESFTGDKIRIPDGKPAVVYFFAPGCVTCLPPLKNLGEAHRKAGGKADFAAINIDPKATKGAREFLKTAGATAVPAASDTGRLATAWEASALGTTIVVDNDGIVRWRGIDPPPEDLQAALKTVGVA